MERQRDPEQRDPARPSRQEIRETLIERQIREAMADGRFDDLPHQGGPLPLDEDALAGEWAMAFRMLRNAGAAPPWIEADKTAREQLEHIERLVARGSRTGPLGRRGLRAQLETAMDQADQAIARLNAEAPTDRQHRRPVDRVAIRARLEAALRG